MSGSRHSVVTMIAAGAVLLVAAVGSAGFLGGRGGPTHATDVPVARATPGPTTPDEPAAPPPAPPRAAVDEALLDPAAMPLRAVERAAVVLAVVGASLPPEGVLLGFDADATDWVRVDAGGVDAAGVLGLSPDGRRLLTISWAADRGASPAVRADLSFVDLGTAQRRPVPVPGRAPDGPACMAETASWAPDGRRVVVVSACFRPHPSDPALDETSTEVHEVDLVTGDARLLERVPGSTPSELAPSWSPDGRYLAYGIGYGAAAGAEEEWQTLRVVEAAGAGVQEWFALRTPAGDPWLDGRTLVARDDHAAAGEPPLLLDARSGERRPAGPADVVAGSVRGALITAGPGGTCPAALCLADPASGEAGTWLTAPDGVGVVTVWTARDLVGT